jgi:SAM-dependent methyltransferase
VGWGAGSVPGEEGILAYYARGREQNRLEAGPGLLERARTWEVLERHLPPPPSVVLDVGGGAGAYAVPLATRGYEVHLRDPLPLHVEQATAAARAADTSLVSAAVGDARALDPGDGTADIVLMLGPLYHLQEADDRRLALAEADRVLRGGGLLAAAAISRWAPVLHGLSLGLLEDPGHLRVLDRVAETGRFDPLPQSGFTKAYFHRPQELHEEATAAGFEVLDLVGLEGVGYAMPDFAERWAVPAGREALLEAARRVERVPELLGLSSHLLLTARKPEGQTMGAPRTTPQTG